MKKDNTTFWDKTQQNYSLTLAMPLDVHHSPENPYLDDSKAYPGYMVNNYDIACTKAQIDFMIKIENAKMVLNTAAYLLNASVEKAYETRETAFKEALDTLQGLDIQKPIPKEETELPDSPLNKDEILRYLLFLDNFLDNI